MIEYEIRTLAENEKISEPGFYNISLDRHHSQPCDGPSVTSGILRKMELWTPADVWAFHDLNPDKYEKEQTDALKLGRAMAAYIEGGESGLLEQFMVLPASKPRRPTQQQITAYEEGRATDTGIEAVEFWKSVDEDTRDEISAAQLKLLLEMGEALKKNPDAGVAMDGVPEITMATRDETTGLWLLARPDTVNFDGTVTDYKKMNTQGRPFNEQIVDYRITKHGYDMQLAFAAQVYEALTGTWPEAAAIIAQWDRPPYHVILREISHDDLELGMFENQNAIRRFAECLESGHWPGPGENIGTYQRPDWQRDMLLEKMKTEGLAP